MTSASQPISTKRNGFLILLGGSFLFAVAHTQAPLYFSNQHQYCLHGLASGGLGFLDRDWLANTLDPTPVFSALVAFTQRHLDVVLFQVLLFILIMIYFASLMSIGCLVIPNGPRRLFFLCALGIVLTVVHSGIVRWASVQFFGVDYPWYFQCGLAGQYILGPDLQPSAFGVLLVSSVAAFAHGRPVLAIVCSSAACLMHATYLLPAAMLTLTYMYLLWREGRARAAWLLGIASLLAALPVVVETARTFAPTSPEIFSSSQRLLAEVRIPHHAQIRRWFDPIAGLQIAWIILAVIVYRKSKLAGLLGIAAALSCILTLIQLANPSPTLALLFPWRISAVLMPVATTAIFARLIRCLLDVRWLRIVGISALAIVVVGGIVVDIARLGYRDDDRELAALVYVRDHKKLGDVYLLPVQIPNPYAGPSGAVSTSFTPPPGLKNKQLIAVNLQRFRLFTGAPIYVDFKSVPYKDSEVVEWHRCLQKCVEWYAQNDWNNRGVREALHQEGITHILVTADRPIDGDGYELVYADSVYRIYRVLPLK